MSGLGVLAALLEEMGRILGHAQHPHLKVQVGTGGAARAANLADTFAALDELPRCHQGLGEVGVAGNQALAVVDVDHVAEFRMVFGGSHHAAGGGDHRRAGLGVEIDAFVHGAHPGDGVRPVAEAGADHRLLDRQGGGQQAILDPLLEKARFERTTAELFLKFYADRKAADIAEGKAKKEIKIEQLRLLMFGAPPGVEAKQATTDAHS